jgi:hypothetical protein
MQHTISTLPGNEEPSLLSQLAELAGKMPEARLKALVKFLQKEQVITDMAALSNTYKPGTDFPLPFEELGMLLAAQKNEPDA